MNKHQSQIKKDLYVKSKKIDEAKKRLVDLDKLFRKAFEELTLENLSTQQFQMLTLGYETKKQELSARIATLANEISPEEDKLLNANRFPKIMDKYTDIQELTPKIARELVDKIVVYERSASWKKKNYTQQVDVILQFCG